MKSTWILGAFLLLQNQVMANTIRIDCPLHLYSDQRLVDGDEDWEGWEPTDPFADPGEGAAKHRHWHSGIAFYSGHPSKHRAWMAVSADLPLTFSFGKSSEVFMVCHYHDTVLTFVRSVGKGVSKCIIKRTKWRSTWREAAVCELGESD